MLRSLIVEHATNGTSVVILRAEPAGGRLPLAKDTGTFRRRVLSRSFIVERATKDLSV